MIRKSLQRERELSLWDLLPDKHTYKERKASFQHSTSFVAAVQIKCFSSKGSSVISFATHLHLQHQLEVQLVLNNLLNKCKTPVASCCFWQEIYNVSLFDFLCLLGKSTGANIMIVSYSKLRYKLKVFMVKSSDKHRYRYIRWFGPQFIKEL